jgi:putative aldouronate transport system permease protein
VENANYGVATAVGLFKSVVSFVMVGTSYLLAYRLTNYRIF